MKKISKKTFLKRLEENKFQEDIDKTIEYKLPVVQYYFDNLIDVKVVTHNGPLELKGIQLKYEDKYFPEINLAFKYLVDNKNKFKEDAKK